MYKKRLLYIYAFSSMFMMGYIDSMRGPLIHDIKTSFNISYSSVGIIFFAAGLGFLISSFLGGLLCDRLGHKAVGLIGFIFIISGIAGISFSKSFAVFLFMMGILNLGFGSVEIDINSLVSIIAVSNQAVILNLLHFFYGAGAIIGPRYSGQLLSINMDWRSIYILSLTVIGIVFVYFISIKFPELSSHESEGNLNIKYIIKDKRILLYGAVLGFYVGSEIGISNWFVNYLTEVYHFNELVASTYLSIYFTLFTLGRLFGGFIAEKFGYFNSVIISMLLSLVLFLSGALIGGRFVIFISICGLTYSIVFPTLVSSAVKGFKNSTGSVLGFIIMMSAGISMILNWFIGELNDIIGVLRGFNIIIAYIIIVIVLAAVLKYIVKEDAGFEKRLKAVEE